READCLGLEDDSWAGGGRRAERAAERGAERGPNGGDLVLRLERAHAERLVPCQLLEDGRGRRDRVGPEKEIETGEPRRGDEPVRERRVAGDLAIQARRQLRRLHLVLDGERFRR